MIIIVDTNIIISACLDSSGELYQILTTIYNNVEFTTPDFALQEIVHQQHRICLKSKKSIVIFQHNLSVLLNHLLILRNEDLSKKDIVAAEDFTSKIDIDDTVFVAFTMVLDSILWTGDLKLYKSLRRNAFTNVILTKELKQILNGL